ncbi:MAG: hypothetical protein ACYTG7_09175 [Planctomycetota bacterium]|jgi:hypothetical protein
MMARKSGIIHPLWLMLLLLVFSPICGTIFAQDLEEEEEPLPDIKALVSELNGEYKKKKERDIDRIVTIYTIFDKNYARLPAKDQAAVIKAMKRAYDLKLKPEEKTFLNANAAALSGMGKKGVDTLLSALKGKAIKPKDRSNPVEVKACMDLEVFIIEAIGHSKQTSGLKALKKLLWHDKGEIIAAACKALSQYNELSVKERKPLVEEMIKVYTKINSEVLASPKRPELRERKNLTDGAFVAALQKLTPGRCETSEEWQRWYNKNKSKKKW